MRRRPDKCPQCGSPRVAEIVYGLPDPALVDADSEADVETERFVLGGCCIGRRNPRWHCLACEYQWGVWPPDD